MNNESGSDASIAGPSKLIISDVETNSSNANSFTVPAARNIKTRKRAFCLVWLEDPVFKPWLQQVQHNPYKGKCSICNIYVTALKSNLQRHANSQEHMKNMKHGKSSVERSTDEAISTDEVTSTDEAKSMDVETNSSSDSTSVVPATKKGWRQTFLANWLEDPAFKPWLQQVQHDPYRGKCSVCNIIIKAKKCNLQCHANSQEHIKNMKYGKSAVERSTDEATSVDVGTDSKKGWRQTFLADWLEDPAFKPWLEHVQDDPYKGKCAFCNISIIAKRCNLQQHANSQKHIDNVKYGKRVVPGEGTRSFRDEVKEAEIRVCTDAIEHNRPFNLLNHNVRLSQEVCKNPNVVKRMSLSAKKMKAISLNVINKSIVGKTIEKIQGKYFSVLIDETIDVSNMKLLCFLIRYIHKEQICTDLLDLIRINDATAENLYHCFKQSLDKFNLPISNLVGVCAGAHKSLISRIVAANDEICVQPCICHSLHLAARHACECLPKDIEKFLQSLYSYFSQNPKRLSMLEGTQQFIKVPKRKIKQPSTTRWLALAECIKRVVDQWTVLFSVLAEASLDNESDAKKILLRMNSPFTKAYLEFLDYYLTVFTTANKLFESSEVLVHRLLPESNRLLALLAVNFIKRDKIGVSDMHKIDIYNEDNLKPLTTIFTGAQCMDTLSQLTNDNWEENRGMVQFFTNIKKCYQTGYQKIVDRVPFDDTFLKALDFLNPQTAAYIANHEDGQLECVLNKFSSKFNSEVLDEWIRLPSAYLRTSKEEIKGMSLPQFWHETSITSVIVGEYMYANISKLAQLCLSLPHSTADVERYFSTVTQIKTSCRNRLDPETLAALTRIKLDFSNQNACCYDYEITDDMIRLFNNSMYDNVEMTEDPLGNLLDEENENTTDNDNN